MYTFIKAQASALFSTLVDFLTTIVCVNIFGFWYLYGSITGTIAGGITNFSLNRHWVFNASKGSIKVQIIKYILVWIGNFIIVTTGVYLLTHYGKIDYIYSKIIISGFIGTIYNYLMQKRFIFIYS